MDRWTPALQLAGALSAAPGPNGDPIYDWIELRPFMSAPPIGGE